MRFRKKEDKLCGDQKRRPYPTGGRYIDVATIAIMCMMTAGIVTTDSQVGAALCAAVLLAAALLLGAMWNLRDECILNTAHLNSLEDDMRLLEVIASLELELDELAPKEPRA